MRHVAFKEHVGVHWEITVHTFYEIISMREVLDGTCLVTERDGIRYGAARHCAPMIYKGKGIDTL